MATTSVMGGSVRRREDPALIQGRGTYTDDLQPVGLLHVAFSRSPIARGKITKLDTSAAKGKPGVVAVYTHEDVAHLGPLLAQVPIGKLRPLLAAGEVSHVGEAIAMVVAEDRYQAQDAAEPQPGTRAPATAMRLRRCGWQLGSTIGGRDVMP